MKNSTYPEFSGRFVLYLLFQVFFFLPGNAQFPFIESFRNSTSPGMVFSGSAFLTAGIYDPPGDGYLRLTDNKQNQAGSAHSTVPFNSNQGLTAEFEYFSYNGIPFPLGPTGNPGDGFCFFLFDGDFPFQIGAFGGSLGYANKLDLPSININGMANAYIGVGLDDFGNYSSTFEGKNGGPGLVPSAVAIRGPGNGQSTSYYVYQTGQQTTVPPFNFRLADTSSGRDPLPSGTGYRKVRIIFDPIYAGSTVTGYLLSVKITVGGAVPTEYLLINNFPYNFAPPPHLKFGFSASTGLATSYHEVRNIGVDVFDPLALTTPTGVNDTATTCSGTPVSIRVTDNDFTPNGGGVPPYPPGVNINLATIDFDSSTVGFQQTFTTAAGTFKADTNGIVTFTPIAGFTGTAEARYFISDVYGKRSLNADTIHIIATTDLASDLTVVSPQVTCSPGTIDLTQNPGVWSVTPAGGTIGYYTDILGTTVLSNPTTVNLTGTYYIKHTSPNTCVIIKPVLVTISSPTDTPVPVNGYQCGPNSVTLNVTGAAAGEDYKWYDASTAGNLLQNGGASYQTVVLTDTTNYWVSKFNTSVPGCESSRALITAFINALPGAVNAGSPQTLNDVAAIQLNGSTPQKGEAGLWTLVTGPNVPTILEATKPDATVTDLAIGTYLFEWTVQAGPCTSSSQVSIQVLSILPVTYTGFTASLQNQQVTLNWSTATESNNNYFVIERSTDGLSYSSVGQIMGKGNSNQVNAYSFIDKATGISSPRLYYRLNQVDLDGKSQYSKVVSVDLRLLQTDVLVSPNPFERQLHVRTKEALTGSLVVSLIHESGTRVGQYHLQLSPGATEFDLFLKEVPSGVYYLEILNNGKPKKIIKLLKK